MLSRRSLVLSALLASLFAHDAWAAASVPASLADLCPADADPCIIDKSWDVSGIAFSLDFGTRTVRIQDSGRLDLQSSHRSLQCGRFEVLTGGSAAIALTGKVQFEEIDGGQLTVNAYRSCADAPATRCMSDAGCTSGTCSLGSGDIVFAGTVRGNATHQARLTLNAAGSADVSGKFLLSGIHPPPEEFTEGGELEIDATTGPVSFTGKLGARGSNTGGNLVISSGGDVVVDAGMKLDGAFDGGKVLITAEGAVSLDGRIGSSAKDLADSFGGEIAIEAGGNVTLGSDRLRVAMRGSRVGGVGGTLTIETPGEITLSEAGRIDLRGGSDQFSVGGYSTLSAGGNLFLNGRLTLTSVGDGGDLLGEGAGIFVGADARIDASAAPGEGGHVDLNSSGGVTVNGLILARGGSGSGRIHLTGVNLQIGGTLGIDGDTSVGLLELDGCGIMFAPDSLVEVGMPGGGVLATVSEQLTVAAGAEITAPVGGNHVFEYRSDGPVPIVLGDVSPDPTLTPIAALPCP